MVHPLPYPLYLVSNILLQKKNLEVQTINFENKKLQL